MSFLRPSHIRYIVFWFRQQKLPVYVRPWGHLIQEQENCSVVHSCGVLSKRIKELLIPFTG